MCNGCTMRCIFVLLSYKSSKSPKMKVNQQKTKVHNLLIIDESASMQCLHKTTIDSINDTIRAIKSGNNANSGCVQHISLFTFNGLGVKMHMFDQPSTQVPELTYDQYRPNAQTPLYDCIGQAVGMVRTAIKHEESNVKVIVTILTDGYENGSKKYCEKSVSALIEFMKFRGWIFNYVGANHDVAKVCKSLNITNYYIFQNSPQELQKQMYLERMARVQIYDEMKSMQNSQVIAA